MTTRLDSTPVPVPDEIVEQLREWLDYIRAHEEKVAQGVTERDHLIVQAHLAGASLREIAAVCGLTHMGVRDVIRRKS